MSTEKPQTGPWGRKLWNVVAILTAIGLVGPGLLMFWLRSPAGPLVLVFCNLLMMAFYGFAHPVNPGGLIWGLVVPGCARVPGPL
jgi:hypothetical protein